MTFTPPPCKDCTYRYIGCHSGCQTWQDWKAADDASKAEMNRTKKAEAVFQSAQYEKSTRYQQRMHNNITRGRPSW